MTHFSVKPFKMEADITSQAVGLASSADFSIVNLFLRADIIVKSVIVILIAASIYSWAIIIDKYRLFKKINKSSEEFEDKFWKSRSAESFYNNLPANIDDPMANLFKGSMQIIMKSRSKSNLPERLGMNSFQQIAISRNTSLAIVAPGIAEALFATALGLLAAIPAVVAFNKFSSDSRKYSQKLENFSKRFISII